VIFQNLFFLARWGFDINYIKNIPLDEFYYYIKLFNKNKELLGIGGAGQDNVAGASNTPEAEPKPIGKVVPSSALPPRT